MIYLLYGLQIDRQYSRVWKKQLHRNFQEQVSHPYSVYWICYTALDGWIPLDGISFLVKKGTVHRTDTVRSFLAAKGFNTNLVQLLLLYYVIIGNGHVCSFTYTNSHMHGHAPNMVLRAQYFIYKIFKNTRKQSLT